MQGLYFLQGTIWETLPAIHRDLVRALRKHYGEAPELPVVVRYRSWIGSDRDGNPNVTADVTRWTMEQHRRAALRLQLEEIRALQSELSIAEHRATIPDALRRSNEEDSAEVTLPEATRRQ
jgi:phosphoenolpyruvate carboxylase